MLFVFDLCKKTFPKSSHLVFLKELVIFFKGMNLLLTYFVINSSTNRIVQIFILVPISFDKFIVVKFQFCSFSFSSDIFHHQNNNTQGIKSQNKQNIQIGITVVFKWSIIGCKGQRDGKNLNIFFNLQSNDELISIHIL